MNKKKWISGARLTFEALHAISEIAEHAHARISPGLLKKKRSRTSGITGFVYRTVQAGLKSSSHIFRHFETRTVENEPESTTFTSDLTFAAVLNGVAGDYLEETESPWSIEMQLFDTPSGKSARPEDLRPLNSKTVCFLIHGLCMHEGNWDWNGSDTGAFLRENFDLSIKYLRYNTGLSIAENGHSLHKLIEAAHQNLPDDVRFVFVTHSMGGLVTRAALHQAEIAGSAWKKRLDHVFFIGTPHAGSPVERAGHFFEQSLEFSSWSVPFKRLGMLRSRGITDLRYGRITHDTRPEAERFGDHDPLPEHVPLPEGISFYAIAADLSKNGAGDGLVTVSSALGLHADPQRILNIPESRTLVIRPCGHFALLSHPEMHAFIANALAALKQKTP